ncbi:UNVERIFIED_CONTAM: alcohol dehydrogenase class IV [Acetivibrio alkalicellulosi]
MDFKFKIGTKVYFGKNAVLDNREIFKTYGNKALIVTGSKSGKMSGALKHVTNIFEEFGIQFDIFDRVENNPTLNNVKEGSEAAIKLNADFIVGIGGGSPLDASKAIAVLAQNEIEPINLFENTFSNKPLPIIAIPTTAGTGSEVTPYSILTRDDIRTKMSFGNEDTFPVIAFADPSYTESMNLETTVDTALDAFSHAMEGYLSKRSTPVSDILAIEAIRIFGNCINSLISRNISYDIREKLLYVSMLGGMVISHTGTTIIHGLGYSLTYFKKIPHGRANALIMEEYLKYNYEVAEEKINNILSAISISSIIEFGEIINRLVPNKVVLSDEEIEIYTSITMKQKSTLYNVRQVEKNHLSNILKKCFLGGIQND